MAEPTYPETDEGTGREPDDRSAPTGMPRWVKVFGIVIAAIVLLFVVLKLTGIGGGHGPGRHTGGDQEQDGGWDH